MVGSGKPWIYTGPGFPGSKNTQLQNAHLVVPNELNKPQFAELPVDNLALCQRLKVGKPATRHGKERKGVEGRTDGRMGERGQKRVSQSVSQLVGPYHFVEDDHFIVL